jgi:hypothetical protein
MQALYLQVYRQSHELWVGAADVVWQGVVRGPDHPVQAGAHNVVLAAPTRA